MNNYNTEYAKKHGLIFEDYEGWCNRDTWLCLLWLNNDYENYTRITRVIENTSDLQDLSDNELYMELQDFHYGDKINFSRVDLDEVRFGLTDK